MNLQGVAPVVDDVRVHKARNHALADQRLGNPRSQLIREIRAELNFGRHGFFAMLAGVGGSTPFAKKKARRLSPGSPYDSDWFAGLVHRARSLRTQALRFGFRL